MLRLNRPERKNALNGALFGAITTAVLGRRARRRGVGARHHGSRQRLLSGLDLDDVAGCRGRRAGADDGRDMTTTWAGNFAMLLRVECDKPVIAGINGVAVGIGVSLAMAADVRIAAPSARFHPGYARVGTSPDGGGTWTVTQALGYEGAMRFFLEQRMVVRTRRFASA